jgi:hypothetical protein
MKLGKLKHNRHKVINISKLELRSGMLRSSVAVGANVIQCRLGCSLARRRKEREREVDIIVHARYAEAAVDQ